MKGTKYLINHCQRSTAERAELITLVLPAVVLGGEPRPGLGPGVGVSPTGWELSPVAW